MSSPLPNAVVHLSDARLTQAERSARSDKRMLDTAIKLIVEKGTEGTTLKEVGEAAGYSRGLAGYRFGSKAGLFGFVVHAISEEWLAELKAVTTGKSGLAAIHAATDAHYRFCREAPDHVRAFYMLWFESISPGAAAKEVITGIHRRRQSDVAEWISSAISMGTIDSSVDADAVAAQFCSALVGIVYQWLLNPTAMSEIKKLHDGLKRTMVLLLSAQQVQGS